MRILARAVVALVGFAIVWVALALIYAAGMSPAALLVGALGALTIKGAARKE